MSQSARQSGLDNRGRVVAGRFRIEEEAGQGGAGTVYLATDMKNGERVALKVLRGVLGSDLTRFVREAQSLAQFRHPHVVQYVAHGIDEGGEAYLVMEWLEGEDLRTRLQRSQLTLRETMELGRRTAEALTAVHAAGLLHRDIKPGNLFLPGGEVERVKLLDFGLARRDTEAFSLTQTGVLIGTPGYMAPEQARGHRNTGPRGDIFSLGCVLYKCLSGQAPFDGSNLIAVMTKVILEEAPPLRELRPGIPEEIAALVHRMLSKEPDDRPKSAADVAETIAAIHVDDADTMPPAGPSSRTVGLTAREVRVAAVLLVGNLGEASGVVAKPEAFSSSSSLDREMTLDGEGQMLSLFVAEQSGHLERLADGTRVITLARVGAATDQAIWAARCALALRAMMPGVPMALAMGLRAVSGATPMGEAIDRATALLGAGFAAVTAANEAGRPLPSWIAIDDATAGLLDSRFDVRRNDGVTQLAAARDSTVGARRLLGKATPIVGRDWELSTVVALFSECVDGPAASAVLVTGPAGMGKSRLAQELVAKFQQACPEAAIWFARGDSQHLGSPLHLLNQALRSAMQIGELSREEQQQRIEDAVAGIAAPEVTQRAAELLGEIMHVAFPDDGRAGLRAARADAILMGEQMRWAWETFVTAECSSHPVALFLDDLHWGDLPSLKFIESALGSLARLPFMVVMLARPDVHDLFPQLWKGSSFQEIRLKPLTPKASERLVQNALGSSISPHTRARLAARADGNAFYLEELIRSLAESRRKGDTTEDTLPETVIATVQARLGMLDDDTRRLLRAASVFGEVFWTNGVLMLLGDTSLRSIGPWMDALVAREVLVRRASSRFSREPELAFRHALLRDGAYSMLTEEDRALGHRLAGEWLERAGELDAMVLAHHAEKGGDPERAAQFHAAAAEQAMRGQDIDGAIQLAQRILAGAVSDDLRMRALATLTLSRLWRLEWVEVSACCEDLLRLAPPGHPLRILAYDAKLTASLVFSRPAEVMESVTALMAAEPVKEAARHHAMAISSGMFVMTFMAQFAMVDPFDAKLDAIAVCAEGRDVVVDGYVNLARTFSRAWKDGDAWAASQHGAAACAAFAEAGDRKNEAYSKVWLAMTLLRLGEFEAARAALDSIAMREHDAMVVMTSTYYRGMLGIELGDVEMVEKLARERIEDTPASDPMRAIRAGEGHYMRSESLRRRGDFAAAERELAPVVDIVVAVPLSWQFYMASLARTRIGLGQTAEALEGAKAALAALEAQGGDGQQGMVVRLAYIEALDASGDRAGASVALAAAHDRVMMLAERISDEKVRRSFLERVEENARIVMLARAWLGRDGAPARPHSQSA